MNKRLMFVLLGLVVAMSMVLVACARSHAYAAPVVATEPPTAAPTEPPVPAVGSPEHPIKVLFVPSVDANIITPAVKSWRRL